MDPQMLQDVCQQTQQRPLLVFAWTLLCVVILTSALRLYSRSNRYNGISIDDYIALASTVLAAVTVSFLTVWIHSGLGRHVQCLHDSRSTLRWSLLTQTSSIVGICLIKISVGLYIRRVLEIESNLLRISICIIIVFISASHIAQAVLLFLQCRPLHAIWSSDVHNPKCFTHQQLSLVYYIGYSLDALSDLICALLAVVIAYHAHLNKHARIGLYVLIGFGTLITGCAIVRTVTAFEAWTTDYTWNSTIPVWFAIAEYQGGIIIAGIPSLAGLFVRSAHNDLSSYERARNKSFQSINRKGSAWTVAPPRIALPGAAKKHFSISTFGMSEGEVGSRLTLVDNRLTVVGEDEDRLTSVAEEGDNEFERVTLDNRSTRTVTLKSSHIGWNQEDVLGLGMLGKDDTFGRGGSEELRNDTRASSISSVNRITPASTPKRTSLSLRPTTPRSISTNPHSRSESPKSPNFPSMLGSPKSPKTRRVRRSVTSSVYSDAPASAGLATLPSPPANSRDLPFVLEASSRPTTPKTPKIAMWTTSPSGSKAIKGTRTANRTEPSTQNGLSSRTPQSSNTPRGGSSPGTPERSLSVFVPRSKFQAEVSGEVAMGARRVNKSSELGTAKSKALPQPPLELRVINVPAPMKFDSHDVSY